MIRFAAVMALAAGMAFAQTPSPTPQAGAGGPAMRPRAAMHRRMMQALDLTDAQKQQAKAIFQEAKQSTQPFVEQLKQNRPALAAAVKANNTTDIQQLAKTQGNLRGQVLAIRSEAFAKFYNILTPEQRAKADQIQQKIHQRMQRLGRQGE